MEAWLHLLCFLHAVLGRRASKAFADAKIHFWDFSLRETIASQRNDLNSCSLSWQHIFFTLSYKITFLSKLLSAVKIRCCSICLYRCWTLLERVRDGWKMEGHWKKIFFSCQISKNLILRRTKKCSSPGNHDKIYRRGKNPHNSIWSRNADGLFHGRCCPGLLRAFWFWFWSFFLFGFFYSSHYHHSPTPLTHQG